jgi:hypothetical protein
MRWVVTLGVEVRGVHIALWRTDSEEAVRVVKRDLVLRLLRAAQDRRLPAAFRRWARAGLERIDALDALAQGGKVGDGGEE